MANAPLDSSDYADPSPVDSVIEGRSLPTYITKYEGSPADSPSASLGLESVITDTTENNGPSTTAGQKRKLNSTSSRGVANLIPDQLAKKRANDRQAQRAIRERTKGHNEALEKQVRELSLQKPFFDLQAAIQQNERIWRGWFHSHYLRCHWTKLVFSRLFDALLPRHL